MREPGSDLAGSLALVVVFGLVFGPAVGGCWESWPSDLCCELLVSCEITSELAAVLTALVGAIACVTP